VKSILHFQFNFFRAGISCNAGHAAHVQNRDATEEEEEEEQDEERKEENEKKEEER
jgi:hypothetical protein